MNACIVTENGTTLVVCNEDFFEACEICELRFKCFTLAKKWMTAEEWQLEARCVAKDSVSQTK